MTVNAWIIVAGDPGIKNLVDAARSVAGHVHAVVVGDREVAQAVATSGVDEVTWCNCPEAVPIEACAAWVGDLVAAAPGILIGGRRPAERVLLGAAAAASRAPVLTGASSITVEADKVVVTHLAFGGITEQTVSVDGPIALVLDGGGVASGGEPCPIKEATPEPMVGVEIVERRTSEARQADLASASRVVGVGRGLCAKEDLGLITQLADVLGAEIGCSRPLSEGLDWLGRDRYIGISGQHIAPQLYLAVGLSGQLQHIDGVRGAEVIVAVNSDPKAPIVEQSDYVLVGDLYDIVPALTAGLSGA